MIKINLVREGRAVRGAGAVAAPTAAPSGGGGGTDINNILIVALLLIGGLAAGAWWWLEKRKLNEKQATVAQRKTEAEKLEAIIRDVEEYQKRKDNLQKRIDLINQLKQNQRGPVRIMDQVSRDLPDLVWLDKMTINAGSINISGRGLNPNAIANFVENVKNDPYFEEPQLGSMTQTSVTPLVYTFDMSFGFSYAPKTAGGAADTTSTTGTTGTGGTAGTAGTAAPGGAKQ
ncbi:MAG: PilN domain-containing protein [Acidobacteria bacterium]|nr:PilN domain-containing protein [Acidobacteriota bacterium]